MTILIFKSSLRLLWGEWIIGGKMEAVIWRRLVLGVIHPRAKSYLYCGCSDIGEEADRVRPHHRGRVIRTH